jgi:hypothetical protein
MISSASVNAQESKPIYLGREIIIRPEILHKPSTSACWHALFHNRVVARGFPVLTRFQGVGFEISFQNMAAAGKVLSFVEYENGLIAHGLTSVLIPMKGLYKDDAIQWHFEDKRNPERRKLARISQVLHRSPFLRYRHKELEPQKLINRRCFFGLTEHANVVIGTKNYQRKFEWSCSDYASRNSCIKTHSITLGTGFLGLFSGKATQTRTSTMLPSAIYTSQEQDIFDVLDFGRENLALLFDTAKNIGWYIPKISVALQMTHAIISKGNYAIYDGDYKISKDSALGFADAGPDAATQAANAVKNGFGLRVKRHHSESTTSEFISFCDMFKRTYHTLSDIKTGLESAEGEFREARHTAPKFIHGVELLDAMHGNPTIRIKTAKVDQGRAHLMHEQPLIIFSRHIEPPIIPEHSSLRKSWQVIPSNRGYLVSMGHAISSLLDRREEGLADGLDWNFRTELIQSHKPGKIESVNHAQKLVSKRKARSNTPLRRLMLNYQNACFVFGPDAENECKEPIVASTKLVPQTPNAGSASMVANPSLCKQIASVSTIKTGPEKKTPPAIAPSIQNSATIRLTMKHCESEGPLYVVNGSPTSADHSSRSLAGKESSLRKRTPRIKNTLQKIFSSNEEKAYLAKLTEQTEPRTLGNESVDPGEYDDLYNA